MSFQHRNLLIESLPREERQILLDHTEGVLLPLMTVLHDPAIPSRYVYFPTSGIASVVTCFAKGESVEVGLIGREGVTSSLSLLGPEAGLTRCMMQTVGTALRIPMTDLQRLFRSSETIRSSLLEFIQHEAMTLTQLAACNRLHPIEQRLARSLLMLQDRSDLDELSITQEFMAEMLGSQRSTVTVSAGALQRHGMIAYSRGRLRILDRVQLRRSACSCYPIVQQLDRNLSERRTKFPKWSAPSAA